MSWRTEVNLNRGEGPPLVVVEGDVDLTTSSVLEQVLRTARQEGSKVIEIDLSGTRFIDSCGVRLLAATSKELKAEGGRLVISGCPPRSARTFTILGLGHLVDEERLEAC